MLSHRSRQADVALRRHNSLGSALRPCSQAGLNLCAFPTVSIRSKPTFVPLRYSLAGYRPSKTAHLTLSLFEYSSKLGKLHTFQREVLHCCPKAPSYSRQSKNMESNVKLQ